VRSVNTNFGKWAFAVVLILLGAGWVAGIVAVLQAMGNTSPPIQAQAASAPSTPAPSNLPSKHVYLTLQAFPNTPTDAWMQEHHYSFVSPGLPPVNGHEDWVRYGPNTNLVLPAHALVTMTIENYDGQSPILNQFYSNVQGTVGGVMTVNGKTMKGLDPSVISHTFTIHSIPNSAQPWLFVSVPLLGIPDDVEAAGADNGFPPKPEVMQFSFVTGGPGNYIWQCFDPCGWGFNGFGGPMQTRGFMSGTVTVK
jgi:hypothetical protein